jgi:hypothetical protein
MVGYLINWEESGSGHDLTEVLPQVLLGGTEMTKQDSCCANQDSKQAPSEYTLT